MSGFRRFLTRVLSVGATFISLAALAVPLSPSALAFNSRSGEGDEGRVLHLTKVCSPQPPPAFTYCTFTSSNVEAIPIGSRVVYLQAAGATALDSDIVLVVGPGNYALGHVHLPFPFGPGQVTLSGGTGHFTRFHASVVVTRDFTTPRGWFWDGTYRVGSGDDSAQAESAPSKQRGDGSEGDLHVTKECSHYTGLADSYCTITTSNLSAIKPGSRVLYLQAAGATALDSDVILVVGPGNYALGHVDLPFPAGPGRVRLSGGTGAFTGFRARVVVTRDFTTPRGWFWDGTYRLGGDD